MKINIVLVRTEYPANVGAAARALANMAGDRLILIDPQCEINDKAKQMAAGAQSKLSGATIHSSWAQFYAEESEGVRLALTRRGGSTRKVFSLEQKISELPKQKLFSEVQTIYLIFGPEADGLATEDLAYVHAACHLPVYGEFASLNLAQAVLLALYIVREKFKPNLSIKPITGRIEPAVRPFYFPDRLIKDWLTAMGFDVKARRSSAYLTLRRLFLQNQPTAHEVSVLEAILQQNIRKLKAANRPCDETTDSPLG